MARVLIITADGSELVGMVACQDLHGDGTFILITDDGVRSFIDAREHEAVITLA